MDGYRPDAIVIDAPRKFHLPKVIVFLGVEGLLIATGVLAYSEPVPQLLFVLLEDTQCVLRQYVGLVAVLHHLRQACSETSHLSL